MLLATWWGFPFAGIGVGPRMLKKWLGNCRRKLQFGLCLPVFKELDIVYSVALKKCFRQSRRKVSGVKGEVSNALNFSNSSNRKPNWTWVMGAWVRLCSLMLSVIFCPRSKAQYTKLCWGEPDADHSGHCVGVFPAVPTGFLILLPYPHYSD